MTMLTQDTGTPDDRLAIATRELDAESALAVRSGFGGLLAQAENWATEGRKILVTSEDDKAGMKLARESRLGLRQVRIAAEKARKTMKEDSLRRGKAVDGAYKILADIIEPIEKHLEEQETFAERAEKRRREERAAERAQTLRALEVEPTLYADLGGMAAEQWESVRMDAERAKAGREEARRREEEVRAEAERQAAARREEERLAAAERERERAEREAAAKAENDRLRAEAAEREAAAKAERERIAAERRAEEQKARAEREAAEAEARKAREDADRARREAEALRAKAEREARERAEAEAAAKRDAEAAELRRLADEDAAREAAAVAPDREKIAALGVALAAIQLPTCTGRKGKDAVARVAKMVAWVIAQGATL